MPCLEHVQVWEVGQRHVTFAELEASHVRKLYTMVDMSQPYQSVPWGDQLLPVALVTLLEIVSCTCPLCFAS